MKNVEKCLESGVLERGNKVYSRGFLVWVVSDTVNTPNLFFVEKLNFQAVDFMIITP